MKIKHFTQKSTDEFSAGLITQIEKWLEGKEFSFFHIYYSDLQLNDDFDYLFSATITYEEK